ncbi:HEAT repeat domain-containing protein [Sphingosinicella terrae]|uniref:HEAT repeat domain-containing protein n=1 Tax=Sphingosinicella terrae TaxID=2172047 RepID=UPI000E0D2962|nr:HEAT repeat domain-containing protein [Sphingosinicella terrae]
MIVGPELRRWAGDKQAQRRSRDASDAFAEAWNEGAVSRALRSAMADLPDRSAPSVARSIQSLFADSGWIGDVIDALAAAALVDPYFVPPFRKLTGEVNSGLLVYEDDLVSLACATVDISGLAAKRSAGGRKASIHFSGQVELFKFLDAGRARLRFWSIPPIGPSFSAATAGSCEPGEARDIADGEILQIDGRCESFVIEQAHSSLLLLQASIKPDRAPVSVEYDHETRSYLGCSAADDSASRIQMITSLLRTLGTAEAVPAMVPFLDHHCFFVRWHVMRELLGLDIQASLPHLKRMAAHDPHPETRRAARNVLDRLQAPPPARAAA